MGASTLTDQNVRKVLGQGKKRRNTGKGKAFHKIETNVLHRFTEYQ